jgi:hypothetical protein
MRPKEKFKNKPKDFWANIRTISQQVGYTIRGEGQVKIPIINEIKSAYESLGLNLHRIVDDKNILTEFGEDLLEYFKYRADILNTFVKPRLMSPDRARSEFNNLYNELNPKCPIPMNKQKGDKKAAAYFTAIINMLIDKNCEGFECDFDPRILTTITRDGLPLRTLSRRVDGAFTNIVNPIAVWEIKEYYYTTTFGSRVADGVYETLLDGMELEELHDHEDIEVLHYLMVDAYYTWWDCGKSYLCRIIDMLHMGYVDEVLFGYEVIERMPFIVKKWVKIAKKRELQNNS